MQISFLVEAIVGLVILLGISFFLLFMNMRKQKKSEPLSDKKLEKSPKNSLQTLLKSIKNKNTSTQELQIVVNTILDDFGMIKEEDFNLYAHILLETARHPNANKNIILTLDKGLCEKNPTYKKDISNFTSQGLNSRRV